MTVLGKIRLGSKEYIFQKSQKGINSSKFLENSKSIITASILDKKTGKFIPFTNNRLTKWGLNAIGTGLNLVKTPGFKSFTGLMALGMLGAGAIGYLLGRNGKDEKVPSKMHTVEPVQNNMPVATIKESKEDAFLPIATAGTSWAEIVNTYYPELVEACQGQLYGKDGAIRKLKLELSKCDDIDLVNSSDIPRRLNLPLEIAGIRINKDAVPKKTVNIVPGGHTDIREAGCKNSRILYTVSDKDKQQQYTSDNLDIALDSLKGRTKIKEYKLDYAS